MKRHHFLAMLASLPLWAPGSPARAHGDAGQISMTGVVPVSAH